MTELDSRTAAVLDRAAPRFEAAVGDWDAVMRDARRPRQSRLGRMVAVAFAFAAVLGAVVAWPVREDGDGRLLEQARAAIKAGHIFHVAFAVPPPGRLVDLRSGKRVDLRAVREVWFEPSSRNLRTVLRVTGSGVDERWHILPPLEMRRGSSLADRFVEEGLYEAIALDYPYALEHGLARIVDEGEVDGRPVAWTEIAVEAIGKSPDLSTLEFRNLAVEAAIDRRTHLPIAVRRTLDGTPIGPVRRVGRSKTVPRDAMSVAPERFYDPSARSAPLYARIRVAKATVVQRGLSAPAARTRFPAAVWAGRKLAGVGLARINAVDYGSRGKRSAVAGLEVRYGVSSPAGLDEPYVVLREAPRRLAWMPNVRPPAGMALVGPIPGHGPAAAFVVNRGAYLTISASSEEFAFTAARALRPIGR